MLKAFGCDYSIDKTCALMRVTTDKTNQKEISDTDTVVISEIKRQAEQMGKDVSLAQFIDTWAVKFKKERKNGRVRTITIRTLGYGVRGDSDYMDIRCPFAIRSFWLRQVYCALATYFTKKVMINCYCPCRCAVTATNRWNMPIRLNFLRHTT